MIDYIGGNYMSDYYSFFNYDFNDNFTNDNKFTDKEIIDIFFKCLQENLESISIMRELFDAYELLRKVDIYNVCSLKNAYPELKASD